MVQPHDAPPPDSPLTPREERLLKYLYTVLTMPNAREDDFPEDLRGIGRMRDVHSLLWGIRKLAHSLANGELDYQCRERGFVVGSLKAFQSNLRHLTWQAQSIAQGEYHHRVNFLGDFSLAFNQMAEQLGSTINTLTNLSEEYKNLSRRDPLTGLYNRIAFMKFAEQSLRGIDTQQSSTLIIMDIDKFKNINDTYGHLCGDEVLRQFSSKILSTLRAEDLCCRYGGEEFLILMPETPLETGVNIAERLRTSIEDMIFSFEKLKLHATASFGLSEIPNLEVHQDIEDCIKSAIQIADENLYKAKSTGRNRVIS